MACASLTMFVNAPDTYAQSPVCPNYREILSITTYPRDAARCGLEGEVIVEFTLAKDGEIRDVVVKQASHSVFTKPALDAMDRLTCTPGQRDLRIRLPFNFKLRGGTSDQSNALACMRNEPLPSVVP